jgi:hypothetical protein
MMMDINLSLEYTPSITRPTFLAKAPLLLMSFLRPSTNLDTSTVLQLSATLTPSAPRSTTSSQAQAPLHTCRTQSGNSLLQPHYPARSPSRTPAHTWSLFSVPFHILSRHMRHTTHSICTADQHENTKKKHCLQHSFDLLGSPEVSGGLTGLYIALRNEWVDRRVDGSTNNLRVDCFHVHVFSCSCLYAACFF